MSLGDIPLKQERLARVRRVERGSYCGYRLSSGRLCLSQPEYPGQPCYNHTVVPRQAYRPYRIYEGMASMATGAIARTKTTALHQILGRNVSDDDQMLLTALLADEDTLQDIDTLLKIRLIALERQRAEHEIAQKQYDDTFFRLSEQVRKNRETQMKAKLVQAQLSKDDPNRFGADAFDPAGLYGDKTEE